MATQFARSTAIPCTLAEIKSGSWVQNDGLIPSGVQTARGMLSRVNVIGVIVDKAENTFSVDDGTSIVRVRSFDAAPAPIRATIGDLVVVIGRPREYQNERFLVLEIVKRLRNPAWVEYRKKELSLLDAGSSNNTATNGVIVSHNAQNVVFVAQEKESVEDIGTVGSPMQVTKKNPFELLVECIRGLDVGVGADIETVLARVQLPDAEQYLHTLIEEGELFEVRPGKIKVLE